MAISNPFRLVSRAGDAIERRTGIQKETQAGIALFAMLWGSVAAGGIAAKMSNAAPPEANSTQTDNPPQQESQIISGP